MRISSVFFLFLHFTICVLSGSILYVPIPLKLAMVLAGAFYGFFLWLLVKYTFNAPSEPLPFWDRVMLELLIIVFATITVPTIYSPYQGGVFAIPFIMMHQISTLKILEWRHRL